MPRFTREQLEAYRDHPVSDLIGPDCRLLIVGVNPGLWTAATQTHFCHPSNRFYPALTLAGLIDFEIDTSTGMTDEQRGFFTDTGMGITNLVNRATAKATELSTEEVREGGMRLTGLVGRLRPPVVAVAGVGAYRVAFDRPRAELGRQTEEMAGSELWVVPNPSGLNAHAQLPDLARWFRALADAAGLG
jgi:double-stranded uracil-DNA glycosylase